MKKDNKKNFLNFTFLALLILGISLIIFLIFCLAQGRKRIVSIFFDGGNDYFMDFFNQLRDVHQGKKVYTDRKVIYPPMANLIFLIFSRIVSNVYLDTSQEEKYTWGIYPSALISAMLFTLLLVFLFVMVYSRYVKGGGLKKFLIVFLFLFSSPILFAFERGNIILLSIVCSAIYMFTYESQNKIEKEIGIISLAFAFSLKLYPAILAVTLIFDKRFKDILKLCGYALIFLLIPSFFFGGPIAIWQTFKNILSWSGAKMTSNPSFILHMFYTIGLLLGGFCILGLNLLQESKWKIFLVCFMTIFCIKSLQANYMWGFLIAPVIMLCNKEQKFDIFNVFYFIGAIIPIACFVPFGSIGESIIRGIGFSCILVIATIEVIYKIIVKKKNINLEKK